jgi:outer membrane lipoprotein-sorting protein
MKRIFTTLIVTVGLVSAAETLLSGKEILNRLEKATTAQDRKATAKMIITDRSGRVQARTLQIMTKGNQKMMITFDEPADLRGVTFMSTSSENMWIYLPAQVRVRRISGSMINQSFGGANFSYQEMMNVSFNVDDKKVNKAEEAVFNDKPAYMLTMQEGDDSTERSHLWVDKALFLPLQMEKLDKAGKVVKRASFRDFTEQDSIWTPKLIRMDDLARGSKTEINLTEFNLNIGVKENLFTVENMKRGV